MIRLRKLKASIAEQRKHLDTLDEHMYVFEFDFDFPFDFSLHRPSASVQDMNADDDPTSDNMTKEQNEKKN